MTIDQNRIYEAINTGLDSEEARELLELHDAAGEHGDGLQVAICRVALELYMEREDVDLTDSEWDRVEAMSRDEARAECARVMRDADLAQDDHPLYRAMRDHVAECAPGSECVHWQGFVTRGDAALEEVEFWAAIARGDILRANAVGDVPPDWIEQAAREELALNEPDPVTLLRLTRLASCVTQQEAADALGAGKNTVARWERGELEVSSIARMGIIRWAREELGR